MNSNNQVAKLKMMKQVNEQVQKLRTQRQRMIRNKYDLENSGYNRNDKDAFRQRCVFIEKADNVIKLCNNIIDLYPTLPSSQSSSKTSSSTINQLLITFSVSTTIAYIYSNFLQNYSQASQILINSKIQIKSYFEHLFRPETIQQTRIQNSTNLNKNITSLLQMYVRINTNLILNLILQQKYSFAIQNLNELISVFNLVNSKHFIVNSIEFMSFIWFGTKQIKQFFSPNLATYQLQLTQILKQKTLTIEQAFSVSHFIFNYDIFHVNSQLQQNRSTYPQIFIQVLQKCSQVFLQNQFYQHSFFTLRHIIQSPIEHKLKHKFQAKINQLYYANKIQESFETQNIKSVECFRCIIETVRNIYQSNTNINKSLEKSPLQSNQSSQSFIQTSNKIMFKLIVNIQLHRINNNQFLSENQKQFIIQNLTLMQTEENHIIIEHMLKSSFVHKVIKQIQINCEKIQKVVKKQINSIFSVFKKLLPKQTNKNIPSLSKREPLTEKSSNILSESLSKQPKHKFIINQISANHSSYYLKSTQNSTYLERISPQQHKIMTSIDSSSMNQHKKISKMIRLCQHGAFINKRNFNSDGGQFKFIKITSSMIKWGKNPQKVDTSPQIYPLKDVKAILYGKITPNFKKSTNLLLKQQLCFSLVLQKRTLDLYCKDYNQVEAWVCGITGILKKNQNKITGYMPGKMRWRKMFAILRSNFIQPLKSHQKNQYYFQNAYSLILFKNNGYKLPAKF